MSQSGNSGNDCSNLFGAELILVRNLICLELMKEYIDIFLGNSLVSSGSLNLIKIKTEFDRHISDRGRSPVAVQILMPF